VLINGERPPPRAIRWRTCCKRISATSVERIDLIRGGAPGVDMQGRTVLANVVLKRTVQVQKVVNLQTYVYPDGFFGPILELEGSRRDGDNVLEGSLKATATAPTTPSTAASLRTDGAGVPSRATPSRAMT
jgi:hypothetical protein